MNKMYKIAILSLTAVLYTSSTYAWFDRARAGQNTGQVSSEASARANCAPATALTNLELNNVRALIETGGSMWQDRSTGNASYFVPKTPDNSPGPSAIYSGALWMAGEDVNNQLKIAALTFRQGNDFWTGPLTISGDAEVDPQTCLDYDKFYLVERREVLEFSAWWQCVQDNTCDENELFPGYQIPDIITNWPAHGDPSKDQDFYLAPFYDNPDGPAGADGVYNPGDGDYPWYDIAGDAQCGNDRTVRLFGDQTYWWVFNDKGNVHTETGGDPIGMEIRAQAFAFTTNDEVNNMTFYNYEMINRSTQTLTNTYFAQWIDPDLGCSGDDYVGCDVKRGLGYCYNADAVDDDNCNGAIPYGSNPPAIGCDFFEGPYKDNDGIDNPGPTFANNNFISYNDAVAGDGIVYKGMGIGYGDSIVDNERFGMRKFMIYTGGSTPGVYPFPQTDPNNAVQYYNYIQGKWQNGDDLVYGGGGYATNPGADPNIPCDYAFPGDSDPQGFGTGGISNLFDWSESTNNNPKGDRRFMQSAGPFTLEPGAVNNITVGIVYARANTGGLTASLEAVRLADDKAQALFDNCFEIVEGPDAPDVTIQELDRELILYLTNSQTSNNYKEEYEIVDPFIVTPDSLLAIGEQYDNTYNFEGYMIYQLKNEEVSASELNDVDKARLVAQCDIKNNVTQLVNWTLNENIGQPEPEEMVNGADEGISHSFRVTTDLFAEGDNRLVNHKKYYFMAIAYGYNYYAPYNISNGELDGQKIPFLASRKSGTGTEITEVIGIPHNPAPEANGTQANSEYGDGPQITRIEGQGNGGLILDLTSESEATIVSNGMMENPTYERGSGPVDVKVVDPLNVVDGTYTLVFNRDKTVGINSQSSIDNANWTLTRTNASTGELAVVESDQTILVGNEQIIPEWGISVNIEQYFYTENSSGVDYSLLLESTIEYEDSTKQWLAGVADQDGLNNQNWIRSGGQEEDCGNNADPTTGCDPCNYNDYIGEDPEEVFENILGGTIAPYSLCAVQKFGNDPTTDVCVGNAPISSGLSGTRTMLDLTDLQSIDIVFTSDKSKWTRCPVLETQDLSSIAQGGALLQELREAPSIDKNGNPESGSTGMGWFPGYVIDLETGDRLNIAYGEDSKFGIDNGRDMQWNPTSTLYDAGGAVWGGKHYIYIFKNQDRVFPGVGRMPAYDEGAYLKAALESNQGAKIKAWRSCMYVAMPTLAEGRTLLETDAKVRIRVAKPYELQATPQGAYLSDSTSLSQNNWVNMYEFSTTDLATDFENFDTAYSALDMINVVPNPYYAYSQYEENRLDNRVKFTNLPERCTISIFTSSGQLVRQFTKDDPLTSFDWDLKNYKGIPIAGGTYIIHIKAEELGESYGDESKRANERIIKWFGMMRPPDLDNF